MILFYNINNFEKRKKACWSPWSQALHASPWWHSVSQWLSYCSQSSRPHKVLTLSPAIWHCLTTDTNISNWIQPLSEWFWPILGRERQHDVFRILCTNKPELNWRPLVLQCVEQVCNSLYYLNSLKKTTSMFYIGVRMWFLSVSTLKKSTVLWNWVRFF